MSSSTAGGGKPSRSASAVVATTKSGYHIFRIDGYTRTKGIPTGECLKSLPFTVGGHNWQIGYYPNGKSSASADYISLSLYLDESVTVPVKVQQRVGLVDKLEGQAPSLAMEEVYTFGSHVGFGNPQFMKRGDLEKSKYLTGDSFSIRCDIAVLGEFHVVETADAATPPVISVPPSDLHRHFGELLQTEKGADVVFEVGGEKVAAHRCVLAARSAVFSAELFGTMKESDITGAGVIRIDDMEAQVFKTLLYFVYTDSLPKINKDDRQADAMFQHLLVAADRYNVERLKFICQENLCRYINVGTVATILTLAEQHNCHGLKNACFSFLSSPANLREVMASDGFDHMRRSCPSVMKELVTMLCNLAS
ncbi:hypothetical protein EJB05_55459, partial [Eragrostis curvula]